MTMFWASAALARLQSLPTLQSFMVAAAFALSFMFILTSAKSRRQRHPDSAMPIPGPLRLPLFGSLFVLAKFINNKTRHQFRLDMAKEYGKIFAMYIANLTLVYLNDIDLIKEAFITKGDVISDRPPPSADNPMDEGRDKGIASANYGKEFKARKALTLHSMKDFGFGGGSLEETAMEEAAFLTDKFRQAADSKKPTKIHQSLVHLAVSNVICSVVFGRRFEYDDEKFNSAVAGIRYLFSTSSFFWRKLPLVRHLPSIQELFRIEKQHLTNVTSFIESQIVSHKEEFDASAPKDFIDLCLLKTEDGDDDSISNENEIGVEHIKNIIIDLFFAGTDTTAASLSWFILYMMRYPEIQAKCQREIDAIPDLENRLSQGSTSGKLFPYTTATLLETQRIASIAPNTLPHRVKEDTTVGGYRLLKGTTVFANLRFLHLDERYWGDPFEFRPERWLDPVDSTKIIQHSHFVPFSLGKRRCLGENLAKAEYSVFGIALLRNFTFRMPDPANPPTMDGIGLVYSPTPYEMVVESRENY